MKRSRRRTAQRVRAFLADNGLAVVEPGASGFVPGVAIRQWRLHVDEDMVEAADLLHETGRVLGRWVASRYPAARHLRRQDVGRRGLQRANEPAATRVAVKGSRSGRRWSKLREWLAR
jgi:hypothetical protein